MSFAKLQEYINYRIPGPDAPGHELSKEYGTENFAWFMYSLVRMAKPNHLLELGTGAGVTAFLAAQAMKDNGFGTVHTVDDASQWGDTRRFVSSYFQRPDIGYRQFIESALDAFDLRKHVQYIDCKISADRLYMPPGVERLDMLYIDCLGTNVPNVAATLAYYLPRMNVYSSLFWDNASTHNHTFLFFEYVVRELQNGRIPVSLFRGARPQEMTALETLVRNCKFTLVHLTDDSRDKVNKHQNSRTWLKIELNDFIPHGAVGGGVTSLLG